MKKLTILLTLITVLIATTTLALTTSDIAGSDLEGTQKVTLDDALLVAATAADSMIVESNFNKLLAEAKEKTAKIDIQKMREQMEADAADELSADQAEAWKATIDLIKDDKVTRAMALDIVEAQIDSVGHGEYLTAKMAERYHLEGDTIETLKVAEAQRLADVKLTARFNAIASAVVEKELAPVKAELAAAQKTLSGVENTLELMGVRQDVLEEVILHTKVKDETNGDAEKLFQIITKKHQED